MPPTQNTYDIKSTDIFYGEHLSHCVHHNIDTHTHTQFSHKHAKTFRLNINNVVAVCFALVNILPQILGKAVNALTINNASLLKMTGASCHIFQVLF